MNKKDISIVLGTYNRLPFLKATIKNIREHGIQAPYEIIVVDGGSTDGTMKWLSEQKDIITIIQHNRGNLQDGTPIERRSWGYFMNLAFKCAQGKYVLMISDDCLLVPSAVMNGYDQFEKMLTEGKKVGGLAFWWRNWPTDEKYKINYSIAGYSPSINHGMYLREALEDVGWIEEDAYMFYCADGDLAYKICKAGYTIEVCDSAIVEHHAHANPAIRNSNAVLFEKDRQVFISRWQDLTAKHGSKGEQVYRSFDNVFPIYKDFPPVLKKPSFIQRVLSKIKKYWVRNSILGL